MRYCSRREPLLFNYYINSKQVVTKMIHRDLGVLMSDNLHWTDHYDLLLKRAYKVLCLLRRSFRMCSHQKGSLHLSGAIAVTVLFTNMASHYMKDIKAIENVQRRATKYILNDYSSDYNFRLMSLNLLPFMMQLELQDILFFI